MNKPVEVVGTSNREKNPQHKAKKILMERETTVAKNTTTAPQKDTVDIAPAPQPLPSTDYSTAPSLQKQFLSQINKMKYYPTL